MKSYMNVICAIKEKSKNEQGRIHDSYNLIADNLRDQGAHRDKLSELWEKRGNDKAEVRSTERRELEAFKLHEMLNFDPATLFPFNALGEEMVLAKVSDEDAFLIFNTCKYKVTSYKIEAGGLCFSFMCGCSNCGHDLKNPRENMDTIVKAIAVICAQQRIRNVVMRHCDGFPYELAKSLGFELREIASKKYRELSDSFHRRIREWESDSVTG